MIRITTITKIYFQDPEEEPFAVEHLSEHESDTDEEPYSQSYKVKPGETAVVSNGWLEGKPCSLTYVENKGNSKVVLWNGGAIVSEVTAGSSIKLYPEMFRMPVTLFSTELGTAETKVTVTIFPR